MSELAEIVEEIKKLKPILSENLDSGDYRTLNAKRGQQARAVETMKELVEEYSQVLRRGSIFILVAGDKKEELIETIKTHDKTASKAKRFGSLIADPENFYRELAGEIHESMYRTGTSNLFDILTRVIENKMLSLSVVGYPQLLFKSKYDRQINTKDDLVQFIKAIINDQVGSEITVENAVRSLVPGAIEKGHKEKITTIILNTPDEDLTMDLLSTIRSQITPYAFLILAGKGSNNLKIAGTVVVPEVTLENTKQAMKAIRDMVVKT